MKTEWRKRLKNIKIRHKIAFPFIFLIILTAFVAGPIAQSWVAEKIRKEAEVTLKSEFSEVNQYFEEKEHFLKVTARSLSSFPLTEEATLEKDEEKLRLVLIPQKIITQVEFVEVVDEKGRVIFSQKGPHKVKSSVIYLESVRQALLDITASEIVKENGDTFLLAAAPVHKPEGIAGAIIVGQIISPETLSKFTNNTYHIAIFQDGKLLVKSSDVVKPIKKSEYKNLLFKSTQPTLFYFKKRPYLYLSSPLHLNNQPSAVLQVFHPAQSMIQAMHTVTFNVTALNLLVVVLMTFVGYGIAHLITDPLHKLVETSRRIAAGDLSSRVEIQTGDELEELASSFNQMVEKLKERTEALEKRIFELSVIQEVSLEISSTLDINKILPILGESLIKLFNADIACVMLIEERTRELKEGVCCKSPKLSPELVTLVEERLAPKFKDKAAQIISSSEDVPFLTSIIIAPLISEETNRGLIIVGSVEKNFDKEDLDIVTILAQQAAAAVSNATLLNSLQETYLGIVRALAIALDARDPYTRGHSEQVARYALLLANELGLSEQEKRDLELAAYLHDLGKIGIRDEILLKPAKLTPEEMKVIREHPSIGASILSPLTFWGNIVPTVRYHHEHYDGGGYPEGLKNDRIPLGARILALADAFDAITSDRPYRNRKSIEEAIEELKRCAGTQFDPQLVEKFIQALKKQGIYRKQ